MARTKRRPPSFHRRGVTANARKNRASSSGRKAEQEGRVGEQHGAAAGDADRRPTANPRAAGRRRNAASYQVGPEAPGASGASRGERPGAADRRAPDDEDGGRRAVPSPISLRGSPRGPGQVREPPGRGSVRSHGTNDGGGTMTRQYFSRGPAAWMTVATADGREPGRRQRRPGRPRGDARPRGGSRARHRVRGPARRPPVAPHRRLRQDPVLGRLRDRPRPRVRGPERRLLQRTLRAAPARDGHRGRPGRAPRAPDPARRRGADREVQRRPRLRRAAHRRGGRLLRAGGHPQRPARPLDADVADGRRGAELAPRRGRRRREGGRGGGRRVRPARGIDRGVRGDPPGGASSASATATASTCTPRSRAGRWARASPPPSWGC